MESQGIRLTKSIMERSQNQTVFNLSDLDVRIELEVQDWDWLVIELLNIFHKSKEIKSTLIFQPSS